MPPVLRPLRRLAGAVLAMGLVWLLASALPAASWWQEEITRYRLAPLLATLNDSEADWQAALQAARLILEIAPAREDIRLRELQLLYEQQQYSAALRAAARIAPGSPIYAESRFLAGLIAFERGEAETAHVLLEQSAADPHLTAGNRQRARRLAARIALARTYITVPATPRLLYAATTEPPPEPPPEPVPSGPSATEAAAPASDDSRPADMPAAGVPEQTPVPGPIAHLEQGYALLERGRPDAAEAQFLAAGAADGLEAGKRAAAWAQAGYLAAARRENEAAITRFQRSIALAPPTRDLLLQLGYVQAAALRWEDAMSTLQQAEAMGGASPQLFQDIGYAARHAGEEEMAAHWFRRALADGTLDRRRQLALKREMEWLEDRFDISLYSALRGNAGRQSTLNPLERSVLQSQGGLGLRYIPPGLGREVGRFAALTGRLLWSYEKGSLSIPSASWQGGLGISLRPLASDNLVIGAERLIAIGRDARADWLLRAGYSWSHMANTPLRPGAKLYLDVALIDPASPDILATGDLQLGKRITPQPWLRLWPHVLVAGNWQDDDYGSLSLLEAGPGLTATLNFDEGRYRAYRASLDISLQYRVRLAGSSAGHSGPLLTLSLRR